MRSSKSLKTSGVKMKTGSIHQTIEFYVTSNEVYDLIMDAEQHSAFTGSPVIMENFVNGKFSVFDGYCTGYNIKLEKGEKIIQAWNFKEDGWPNDHYTICTFIFENTPMGCKLDFNQTGIPAHKVEDLTMGWHEYYWAPMKDYLAGK